MGVFDWIMKGIGFEGDDDDTYTNDGRIPKAEKESRRDRRRRVKEEKKLQSRVTTKPNLFESESSSQNARQSNLQYNSSIGSSNQTSFDDSSNSFSNNNNYNSFSNNNFDTSSFGNNFNTTSVGGYGTKKFVFFKPKNYDDVKNLVEYFKQSEPAVVNLDDLTDAEAQRILDFISGSVCALNGSIKRIVNNIFLVAPDGFTITTKDN